MEIGGNLGFDKEDLDTESKRKRMVLDSFSDELPAHDDIEVELLRKRMDGFSTRLAVALFFFVALLGVFLALAYFYIEREIANLKKEQAELLSPDHIFAQKFDQLSGMGDALTGEIKRQTDALETARQDLKKNADALATRIRSLEQSGDLKQAKETLKKLEASEKASSAKLAEMEKSIVALAAIPALVESIQKEAQSLSDKQKEVTTGFQAMQKKQKNLEDEIALFPIDSVQKGELEAAVRRLDTERTGLENRTNRRLQQMQILLDSMRGAASGTGEASLPRQETLSE